MNAKFRRIQFTPDPLPAYLIETQIYAQSDDIDHIVWIAVHIFFEHLCVACMCKVIRLSPVTLPPCGRGRKCS
ncbi:MAG: AAA family ATPase [Sedimentisphaerales bacterium]|nr:AAA family ATPase [Sedimentisphaerales bacterium]